MLQIRKNAYILLYSLKVYNIIHFVWKKNYQQVFGHNYPCIAKEGRNEKKIMLRKTI